MEKTIRRAPWRSRFALQRESKRLQHGGGDAIRRSVLDSGEWKRDKIGNVREEVQRDHDTCADGKRERKIAARIFYFSCGESNVVPGISGEERAGLRDADGDEQAEGGSGAQSRGKRRNAASGPGTAEIFVNGGGIPTEREADQDQDDERENLADGENILDHFAVLQAAAVAPGEDGNHTDGDELRGRKRKSVAAGNVYRRD